MSEDSVVLGAILDELRGLREDLKRREQRRLEGEGKIPHRAPVGGGAVFPNYGRSKGAPVAGATLGDLEFYANGCRRTLADPAMARYHATERVMLAAIEAELSSRGQSAPPPDVPTVSDDDIPF